MKRKVIQLAGKTFVVSLPQAWAKAHNVRKGQEVEVTEETTGLCIHANGLEEKKKITVDVRLYDVRTVKSILSVLHKLGFDEVEIFFGRGQQETILERVKTNLMGFEVVQQTAERVVIQNVAGDADESLDVLVRRIFLVTLELARGVEHALAQRSSANELVSLEETNNKLTNYCHRLLLKKPSGSSVFLYVLLWLQEKIADDYREIIQHMSNVKITRAMQESSRVLRVCAEEFYAAVYAQDIQEVMKVRVHVQQVNSNGTDQVSRGLWSLKQHILDGLGSLTARIFVQIKERDQLHQMSH